MLNRHTACGRSVGIPASPRASVVLPDSLPPWEPAVVPGKTAAAQWGRRSWRQKGVPSLPGHLSPVKPPRLGPQPLPSPLLWPTDPSVPQRLPAPAPTQPPQPRLPYPAGTRVERPRPSNLHCHCLLQTTVSLCAMQLPFSSPGPGLTWRSHPQRFGGKGGYYNSQNLKLRMNKGSAACHF